MRSFSFAIATCVIAFNGQAALAQDQVQPEVQTQSGPVRGMSNGGVEGFLGIPYAAAPVGDQRWRPPQPVQSWTQPRDASKFGAYCAAAKSTNGPRSESEDCLFINVWRPAKTAADAKLPVYVFIHGGGFINGSSNQADATEIVESAGILGVSFNYRLGALGFFAHPAITQESGDFGLMDQQAALRWVRDNIAAFGGDPARVTLGGESAGGYSVCAHLVAPGSAGLFSQAMMQSGSCISVPLVVGQKSAAEIADKVGCTGPDAAACLRAAPAGKLIDVPYPGGAALPIDGAGILPIAPSKAVAEGDFQHVAIVIGANRDEGRTFRQTDIGWQESDYDKWVHQTFGDKADKVLADYPWPKNADAYTGAYLSGAIFTDAGLAVGIGGCTNFELTQAFAKYAPVYAYEFGNRTGPGLTREHGAYQWGAGHAAELAYLFPSFNNGEPITPLFNEGERALASSMKSYWGAFVRQGVPADKNGPAWPLFNGAQQVLSLQPGEGSFVLSPEMIKREHDCGLWDAHN